MDNTAFILWFDQLGIDDVALVGGKNASLGEMYRNLTLKGVNIPNGYAVTAYSYRYFVEQTGIKDEIRKILSDLDTSDIANLKERGHKVRELILSVEFPQDLKVAILEGYKHMCIEYGNNTDVAVRSSATAEDLPDASFAGQQETFLNIRGDRALLEACKKCLASLFTNRAISYREDKNFDHFNIALSIGVQKMVRSDKSCSGVMFSIDTESGFKDVVLVTGSYGLGENIVLGAVNPDEYYVFKPTLKAGKKPIVSKECGEKKIKMVYTDSHKHPTKNVPVPRVDQDKFVLLDEEVLMLAKWACIIEDHYSEKRGKFTPMDMEWAKDGVSGKIFMVQARPETVQSQKDLNVLKTYVLKGKGAVIVTGKSVGDKIGSGRTNVIKDVHGISSFKKGEVLVTDMTDPDWEPIMKIASAIVTNRGGRTCHAAIISRELGIPCIVGTNDGTELIRKGVDVTVDASQGTDGYVYSGIIKFDIDEVNLAKIPQSKTKIMLNLGNPEQAFEQSFLPNSGVGLARMEFVINSYIQIHPMALLRFDKVKDAKVRAKIANITRGYEDKKEFFIDRLAMGIGKLACAFYPKDVILRFSDFKSNEYANLIGGTDFEPVEDNPMIGWRGSSRYYDDKYKGAFALECQAVNRIRKDMGLTNLKVMVPFCRTVEEGRKVLAEMEKNGLKKGENGLEVYVMCEIPSNVILADEFLDIFDGFSIGSNDLTQLTLGLDRDSELVAHIYDERNEAVKSLVRKVVDVANRRGKHMGFCGQAPSDFPEFAEFLVECGIESMSLNPDTVVKTTLLVVKKEKQLGK
ncbi:MAG: phosphoenolpyruvate synthase [Candidatus Aenigmarchaeota archaeon]|nr:phosphoenolpyruvate synthase [Candidatus Aenigmarchaeota archaeon]